MTEDQVKLVQDSFAQVVPIADQAAVLFYDRLFVIAPEVEPLFMNDMAALATVVDGLDNIDEIAGTVQELGVRHVTYGAKAEHFEAVGAALLWTLEQGLGEQWNNNLEEAWTTAYTVLSSNMIEAGEMGSAS